MSYARNAFLCSYEIFTSSVKCKSTRAQPHGMYLLYTLFEFSRPMRAVLCSWVVGDSVTFDLNFAFSELSDRGPIGLDCVAGPIIPFEIRFSFTFSRLAGVE